MKVDLNPLPYTMAYELIKWCWEHNIDSDKCYYLTEVLVGSMKNSDDVDWTLDIPDKYITFFLIKWSGRLSLSPIE